MPLFFVFLFSVLKKEGDKLVASLEPGLKVIISLAKTLDHLKLHVESKRRDSNYTIGLVSMCSLLGILN